MYTQTEKVNIEPKSYLPVFRISQNDVGRTLKAHLVSDEGTIAIPAGATVTMAGIKPSGLGYTVAGTINGSDVTFETDAVMTDEAGQIESEIRIVDGETLIGTTNVVLNIEPNPHPDDVTDGQREPLVNEITALLNQITAQADRTEEYSSKVLNMTVSAHESQEPTVTKTEGEVVNLDFGLPRGEKGERGERGERGEAGKDGKDGLDGKDGKDGKDGINGVTPDFSIGTVTTLEPNESASVTLTGTEEEPVLNFGIPKGAKGEQGDVSLSDLEKIMVTDTASGAIASFPDGSDLLPALSLVANIVPKQSGSGTPSPENIRPISGWDEVETHKTGKNLLKLDESEMVSVGWNRFFPNPINAEGTYSMSCQNSFGGTGQRGGAVAFYNEINGNRIGNVLTGYGFGRDGATTEADKYVSAEQAKAKYICFNCNSSGATFEGFADANIQLELGTTATAYEPYTATTHTTSLGRTVYGGTVDVVSGVLTVTHAIVDLGTLDWIYSSNAQVFHTSLSAMKRPCVLVCSQYAQSTSTRVEEMPNNTVWNNGFAFTAKNLVVKDTRYTDAQTFKSAMSGVQLVYELAEPQTYQLTPQTINTLSGVNNVWADSGDCSITYYADTKLYIDKKLGGN